jgi:hypothetical protein
MISRYAAECKSGSYPVLLSFPRKRESMFFTDSCFRRNDRVRNVSYDENQAVGFDF